MAISTDAEIDFFGTQDEVTVASPSAVTDGSFSVAGDVNDWTNDDDARYAAFVLQCQWATAPTDGTVINLYARKMNVQSTNDSPAPSANNLDQFVASFMVDGDVGTATDAFHSSTQVKLPNHYTSQVYEFYIENRSGQTISSGWSLFVTPIAPGPHP